MRFIPYNDPLRLQVEQLVQRWHGFAQTHLPSDNNRELVSMICHLIAEVQDAEPKRQEELL